MLSAESLSALIVAEKDMTVIGIQSCSVHGVRRPDPTISHAKELWRQDAAVGLPR